MKQFKVVPRGFVKQQCTVRPMQGGVTPPVLQAIVNARKVRSLHEIIDTPLMRPPSAFPDMEKAVTVIQHTLKNGQRIAIFGDYDADGLTASATLAHTLKLMGGNPIVHVPERISGYGLNIEVVRELASSCKVLITVDCGVRNFEAVAEARALGMQVILTDHHELAQSSPEYPHRKIPEGYIPVVDALLNPKVDYPFTGLAGVGVAFKLAWALLGDETMSTAFGAKLLSLVAMGSVADSVPLVDENRDLVTKGLLAMGGNDTLIGILALRDISGLDNRRHTRKSKDMRPITARDVGFTLAPRLNAAGRLNNAKLALDLLLSEDEDTAYRIGMELDTLNSQRRTITGEQVEAAKTQIEERFGDNLPPFILVWSHSFDVGIIGLIAANLVRVYRRPAAAIALTDSGMGKGSARSINGFSVIDCLTQAQASLEGFGGHPAAAGFSVREETIPELEKILGDKSREVLGDNPPYVFAVDGSFPVSEATQVLMPYLARLKPFGVGNPEPVFHDRVRVRGVTNPHHRRDNWAKLNIVDSSGKLNTVFCYDFNEFSKYVKVGQPVHLIYEVSEHRISGDSHIKAKALLPATQ